MTTSNLIQCTCGRTWKGTAQCHCRLCHRHFAAEGAFTAHKPDAGGCGDPRTMTKRGSGDLVFAHTEGPYGTTFGINKKRAEFWNKEAA